MTSHYSGKSWNEFTVSDTTSQEPRIFFASTCWCINAVVSCIIWWNLRQCININNFSFMNLLSSITT